MEFVFEAALATGLPVWAGFSARRGDDGRLLSFAPERDIPFDEIVGILADYDVAAAGVMHTPSHLIGEGLDIVRGHFDGPTLAYPDSGHFRMPEWQFEETISPGDFLRYASDWVADGTQIVGGCCGLSPEHIDALRPLRYDRS
jgi:S-methylmethionine-dependent homocysteine/selenocysteine methylase